MSPRGLRTVGELQNESRKRGTNSVSIQMKAGTRLRSAVDACEVVVVRAPGDAVDLRCGGHPFHGVDEEAPSQPVVAGLDAGTQLGKRYADEELGLEVLCTKAGEGSISVGESVLEVKGAKPLPASD
jgi:hypothetical protein